MIGKVDLNKVALSTVQHEHLYNKQSLEADNFSLNEMHPNWDTETYFIVFFNNMMAKS